MSKRVFFGIGLVIAVAAAVFVLVRGGTIGVGSAPDSTATAAQAPGATLPPIKADGRVVADGVVVPARDADLSLPVGGIVAEVLVREGEQVDTGQVLLRLDPSRAQAGVAQAEAGLARAQAQLAERRAGALPEEVDAAQAGVDAAQARLDRLLEGASAEELAVAEAAVENAQASLQRVLEGAHPQELIAARAEVENAQAAVDQAQAAYDEVSWREDIGRLPQSLQLQQATNSLNAAQARLRQLEAGPTAAEIAAARAQVRQAQAQLAQVAAAARPSDLAAARAELRRSQAELDRVTAGARPEAIAAAEAEVAAASATLAEARAALSELALTAPFAGTVAEVVPAVGEQVSPGATLVRLADFSGWLFETDDLTELQVVRIEEGDLASVTFDALPDLTVSGVVRQIKPIGVGKQGDVTYTVVIQPNAHEPRLRWNMTAVVAIES